MTNITATSVLDAVYPFNFQDTEIQVLDVHGRVWLTAADLSRALGYKKASRVSELYQRNKDEFTEDMTTVIELQANESDPTRNLRAGVSATGQARIFSTQGCHLVGMLARTDRAKEFRRWVLDVLDGLNKEKHQPAGQQKTYLPNADHLSLRDTMMHPDAFEQIVTVGSKLVDAEDITEWQRVINKKAGRIAARRVEEVQLDTVLGLRILTETDHIGGLTSKVLPDDANLLLDKDIAAYIRSENGPCLRLLPEIIHACTDRLKELYELPLRGLKDEG